VFYEKKLGANPSLRFQCATLMSERRNSFCSAFDDCFFMRIIMTAKIDNPMRVDSNDRAPDEQVFQPGPLGMTSQRPHSVDMNNDGSFDSTVDTDGKYREAARLASGKPISPDEVTGSEATLDNNVPEAGDGLAGFDSRVGGTKLLLALKPGYGVVDKGVQLVQIPYLPMHGKMRRAPNDIDWEWELQHLRATRVFEIQPSKPH
jgi:hypothetical protein